VLGVDERDMAAVLLEAFTRWQGGPGPLPAAFAELRCGPERQREIAAELLAMGCPPEEVDMLEAKMHECWQSGLFTSEHTTAARTAKGRQ